VLIERINTLTGFGIRNDKGGAGTFGARRTKSNGKGGVIEYTHEGVDYKCLPGQTIFMPFTGKIEREARPYAEGPYSGLVITSKRLSIKIFYIEPYPEIIGKSVKIGMPIGKAQDISLKYKDSGVTPHVHVQIEACDPEFFFESHQKPLIVETKDEN
jgi:hypothetical protein